MTEKDKNKKSLDLYVDAPTALLPDADARLLSKAKAYWFFGEWYELTKMPLEQIEQQAERESIILLVAAAHQQLGNFSQAEHCSRLALSWGCDSKTLARVLIAGAFNTLGRIAALNSDEDKIEENFKKAVDIGSARDTSLIAHSRAVREMAKMGLLPQAAGLVSGRINELAHRPSKIKNVDASIRILQSEIELLSHELSIGHQRSQLYQVTNNKNEITKPDLDSSDYKEYLKKRSVSQLGQDLWVLEKTNYKRGGFFIEFGATDGVLLSNTFLLEKEFGWKGICAEPNPKFYERLKKNRDCIISDQYIGRETGHEVEFILGDAFGGSAEYSFDDNHRKERQAYRDAGHMATFTTISLHDFLLQHQAPRDIDYLSIDTEGSEFEILEDFPFDEWNIRLLTVEHNFTERRNDIRSLLEGCGYRCNEAQWDDWYEYEENVRKPI